MTHGYLFQRVVPNEAGWRRPTRGRKKKNPSNYLEKHGFGHEDWNFDKTLLTNGRISAYIYYQPRIQLDTYDIAFAEYRSGLGWFLVGFYLDATYHPFGVAAEPVVLERKVSDLLRLSEEGHLGGQFARKGRRELETLLRTQHRDYRWSVDPRGVVPLTEPVPIPRDIYHSAGKYYGKPTFLKAVQFSGLLRWALDEASMSEANQGVTEFAEGAKKAIFHYRRERSAALVNAAKAAFRKKNGGRLYCEICAFDFQGRFGNDVDGIEAHHVVPVGTLAGETANSIDALRMVCPNCHRAIHRKSEWLNDLDAMRKALGR